MDKPPILPSPETTDSTSTPATAVRPSATGTATLSIGALNTDSTFSGVISSVGSLALTKVGTGTLNLSGANTYTGATTIQNGTLRFTGNKSGTGQVTVQSGGTLAGTATVAGPLVLESGGSIAPGNNGTGTLTLSGNTTLNSGGNLQLELGNVASSDKLALTGTTYTGPSGGSVTVNITAASGFGTGTYPLITGATGISAAGFSIGSAPAGFTYQFSAASGTLNLNVIAAVIPPAPSGLAASGGIQQI